MKYIILTLAALMGISQLAWSQGDLSQIKSIPSQSMGNDQQIEVYLPSSYETGEKSYPVLYILDGQWFFLNGVAIQKTLRGENVLPEMIVVGVDLVSRQVHDSILFNLWDEYAAFVKEDLVDYVDQSYRTNQDKILFGWENNAFIASELLLNESSPFSGAIVSNGGYLDDQMEASFNNYKGTLGPKYLYITNSDKDIYTVRHTEKLANQLKTKSLEHLNWDYQKFNEEVHESLPYISLYHGLRYYYHNYASLVYASIDDFRQKGGMSYLKTYFRERGERFQKPTEIDESTKNTMIWMAWKQDDFQAFDLFMETFADVLTTKRYASAYWQNRLAQYYLKYDDLDHAIEYFNRGIEHYPEEKYLAEMHAGLGKAYQNKGNRKLAKSNFKKAVEIAGQLNDLKLVDYKLLLKQL